MQTSSLMKVFGTLSQADLPFYRGLPPPILYVAVTIIISYNLPSEKIGYEQSLYEMILILRINRVLRIV